MAGLCTQPLDLLFRVRMQTCTEWKQALHFHSYCRSIYKELKYTDRGSINSGSTAVTAKNVRAVYIIGRCLYVSATVPYYEPDASSTHSYTLSFSMGFSITLLYQTGWNSVRALHLNSAGPLYKSWLGHTLLWFFVVSYDIPGKFRYHTSDRPRPLPSIKEVEVPVPN